MGRPAEKYGTPSLSSSTTQPPNSSAIQISVRRNGYTIPGLKHPPLKQRDDIDGLRALAVLPVLGFHFRITGFPGGYAGVDVFFVISGFLITSNLLNQIETETFSVVNFYGRRCRRLFPAFAAMLATLLFFASFVGSLYQLSFLSFKILIDLVILFIILK